jgi:hypothetical protein
MANECTGTQPDGWTCGLEIELVHKENIFFKFHICYSAFSAPYRTTYNAMEAHLICLDQDVASKENALMTDLRCLDIRDALKKCYLAPPATQTDRNIQLIRLEEEVPKS